MPGGRGGAFSGALDRYQAAGMERKLYDTLRLTVPIIDAAVCKIVRLTGGVSVQCESRRAREDLNRFLESVQVNACGDGNRDVSGNLFRTASHRMGRLWGKSWFPRMGRKFRACITPPWMMWSCGQGTALWN